VASTCARSLGVHRAQDARPYANRKIRDLTAARQSRDRLSFRQLPADEGAEPPTTPATHTAGRKSPGLSVRAYDISDTNVGAERMTSPSIPLERMFSQRTGSWAAWIQNARIRRSSHPAGRAQPTTARCWEPPDRRQGQFGFRTDPLPLLQYDLNTGKFTGTIAQG